ncbi:hypothetical protein [Paenibacillus sp. FSL R7-0331]|uniref:hypothetical protein n=1 Tax=Paenibacillus sp. FSL R7-0331 TaxID=1536773 RepID=UPI0004F89D56|nr:hypothetical protein [Paenibacillus sp. FSL R7-0331]AIQ53809.1 hypothetical protein R70331_21285 [Paenibacillus sp. FSL R7-0331]
MKLQIEKWAEETKPFKESDSAHEFFEESVRCYKIGAYKSAFIMSYLSFKTTIRNRILDCTYGKELVKSNPRFWENEIIKKLENDDIWESHLNTIVEASCADENSKKDIGILHFTNGEQVKVSYNNWKNIRNDCAHAKRHVTIDSSTVECFWNYLIDNLSKFYVLGGEEYLSRELENLYKFYTYPEIVNPDTVNKIINDVNVICNKNSKYFFQKLFENLKKTARVGGLVNDKNNKFWKDILESSHENVRDGIIELISNDPLDFFNFYNYYPQLLEMSFSLNPKFIVNDLSNWLNEPYYFGYDFKKTFWDIFVEILDRYIVHVNVDKIVTSRTIDLIDSFKPDERKLRILNSNDVLKKYIFEVSSWFFKTDAGSQYDNYGKFQSKESEYVELCLNYLEWDIECIRIINYALVELESSMQSRSNSASRMNGYSFKSRCERILCKNKAKITNVPNIDLDDYSEVLIILNSCKSNEN